MADPTFPTLHARPARGWLNDPNGLAYVDADVEEVVPGDVLPVFRTGG